MGVHRRRRVRICGDMDRRTLLFALAALPLAPLPARAQGVNVGAINTYLTGLRSAQGRFTQTNPDRSTQTPELGFGTPQRVGVDVRQDDGTLLRDEGASERATDAARATRDHGDPALERHAESVGAVVVGAVVNASMTSEIVASAFARISSSVPNENGCCTKMRRSCGRPRLAACFSAVSTNAVDE